MVGYSNVSTVPSAAPLTDPTPTPSEEGGLVFVVLSCLCACLWAIYITFYHSRVMGYILTRLINLKYIENGQYFKIGKFIKADSIVEPCFIDTCLIRTPRYNGQFSWSCHIHSLKNQLAK